MLKFAKKIAIAGGRGVLPYRAKKHHSTLEMDTFKVMLILSYLASLDNKPRTCL